jgi:uracil-DNA glycosylase
VTGSMAQSDEEPSGSVGPQARVSKRCERSGEVTWGGGDIAAGKMVVGEEWQAMATHGGRSLNGVGARSKGC